MKAVFFNLILLLAILFSSCTYETGSDFNSKKWKNSSLHLEENWDLRWKMMNDLRDKHKLIGMTKTNIEQLLGEPTSINNKEFYYNLGMTGKGINTGTLLIKFDEHNIVQKIIVYQC